MNAPAIRISKPVREQVGKEEWETRVNLAACYRLMADFGMVEMIAWHDYEGVALRLDERERLVQNLGSREAMVLRNHGLLTVAPSIPECFNNMYRLERACQLQVTALSCNTELQFPPQEVVQYSNEQMRSGNRRRYGLLEWPAMLRKLDRVDPSYRD